MTDASEVPEADALAQDQPVQVSEPVSEPDLGLEVPEADALEQSMPVPQSDDDR